MQRQAAIGQVVVVVSAMAGVTEDLIRAAAAASRHETELWQRLGERMHEKHLGTCRELLSGEELALAESAVATARATFTDFCSGFSLVNEVTPGPWTRSPAWVRSWRRPSWPRPCARRGSRRRRSTPPR